MQTAGFRIDLFPETRCFFIMILQALLTMNRTPAEGR